MAAENKNNSKDLTNAKTEGILNEDTSSVRKKGRPRNSELSDVQLALQAKRRLDKKNQKVKKLTRSLARAKKEIKSEEKALTSNVLTKEETKVLPQQIQEHLDETGSHVAFMPNEGPQTDFLAAPEKDVLYGGAAGGGKSFAMLIDPLDSSIWSCTNFSKRLAALFAGDNSNFCGSALGPSCKIPKSSA